jgi:hypothetical protein
MSRDSAVKFANEEPYVPSKFETQVATQTRLQAQSSGQEDRK